jgi:hypothetical protein
VLFFAHPEKIGRETDLGFDLLLAIPVVVVRDDRDHDAAVIAAADLESSSSVIKLIRLAPAHAVAFLPLGGIGLPREPQVRLLHPDNVRRDDHAAGVAGPVQSVQRGIVLGQVGIAGISENRFHEIQVAHQRSRRKESDLHGLFRIGSGGGTNQRAQ